MWNGLMMDCALGRCESNNAAYSSGCGSPLMARLYFYSFTLFGTLTIINLVLAVILDQLDIAAKQQAPNPLDPQVGNSKRIQCPVVALQDCV